MKLNWFRSGNGSWSFTNSSASPGCSLSKVRKINGCRCGPGIVRTSIVFFVLIAKLLVVGFGHPAFAGCLRSRLGRQSTLRPRRQPFFAPEQTTDEERETHTAGPSDSWRRCEGGSDSAIVTKPCG